MKKTVLLITIRKEVRRAMKPTGLLGKRGPARNINRLIKREIDSIPPSPPVLMPCQGFCRDSFVKVGGTD